MNSIGFHTTLKTLKLCTQNENTKLASIFGARALRGCHTKTLSQPTLGGLIPYKQIIRIPANYQTQRLGHKCLPIFKPRFFDFNNMLNVGFV